MFVLFGINPPRNTNHLFNSWSKLGGSNHNHLLLTGAMTFCWAIWITMNDVVFDKGHPKTFLRVLFSTGYGFGLYCSARMTTRNGFLMLTSYQNREPWSSSHRMDGLSFTILDFSFEHVISFNYGCATIISVDSCFFFLEEG